MTSSRYGWALVAVLWFIWLLNYLDRQVIFSVFPLLRSELRLSDFELGLLGTSFLWVYALASPAVGYLGDRFGRKKVIFASLLAWSIMTWATGKAKNFQELLWARGLMGVAEAAYLPAGLALISDHHTERTRALATGLHNSGAYVGAVLGGVAGGWIGERYGWRSAFAFLGLTGIAYAFVAAVALRGAPTIPTRDANLPQSHSPRFAASLRQVCSLRAFPTLTLVFVVMSIANWLVYTWMPIYLYEGFHLSLWAAGYSATFYLQAGAVGGTLLGGVVADKWGTRAERGRLLTQGAGLALAASFLCLAGMTPAVGFLLAALVVFGIGKGAYDCNCMPVLCQIAPPELRSTGYALFNCAGTIAGGAVAAVAGALKSSAGLGRMMVTAGLLLFIAAILLLRLEIGSSGRRSRGIQQISRR